MWTNFSHFRFFGAPYLACDCRAADMEGGASKASGAHAVGMEGRVSEVSGAQTAGIEGRVSEVSGVHAAGIWRAGQVERGSGTEETGCHTRAQDVLMDERTVQHVAMAG